MGSEAILPIGGLGLEFGAGDWFGGGILGGGGGREGGFGGGGARVLGRFFEVLMGVGSRGLRRLRFLGVKRGLERAR